MIPENFESIFWKHECVSGGIVMMAMIDVATDDGNFVLQIFGCTSLDIQVNQSWSRVRQKFQYFIFLPSFLAEFQNLYMTDISV